MRSNWKYSKQFLQIFAHRILFGFLSTDSNVTITNAWYWLKLVLCTDYIDLYRLSLIWTKFFYITLQKTNETHYELLHPLLPRTTYTEIVGSKCFWKKQVDKINIFRWNAVTFTNVPLYYEILFVNYAPQPSRDVMKISYLSIARLCPFLPHTISHVQQNSNRNTFQ